MKNYPWRFTVVILGLVLVFALAPPLMWASPRPTVNSAAGVSDPPSSPADTAKLSFRRIFKSSSPEFIEIVVPEDGRPATYEIRHLDEDPGGMADRGRDVLPGGSREMSRRSSETRDSLRRTSAQEAHR